MADKQRLSLALKNADAAGDTAAAKRIAQAIRERFPESVQQSPQEPEMAENTSRFADPDPISAKALQGVSFGLGDEFTGAIQTPFRMIADGQGISEAFNSGRDAFNRSLQVAERDHPILSTAAEIGGALATGTGLARAGLLASSKLAANAGLKARAGAAAIDGAATGAAFGAGNSEGLGRVSGAATGAAVGGAIGGAIPVAADVIKSAASPLVNTIKAKINPQGAASAKIAQRLQQDGTSIDQVRNRLGNGLNVADVAGEGTRGLLKTTTNIASGADNAVTTRLKIRQMGQGDRIKTAIARTFANPDGFLTAKDDLAASAKKLAGPLYEKAYANPVPFTEKIESVLNTSAGKEALRKAMNIASNEQVPFQQMFANIADDGAVTIKRVPDMRAWDYIKRGLDDVIDSQTDNITGKVSNSGRAVVGLKKRLLSELDRLNPDYAKARQAYAGIAQIDEALEFGKSATRLSPEAVRRKVSQMSVSEKEAARIGMAETLRKQIDDAGFTHNALRRIMGNRSQFQRLRALFDNPKQFKEFRSEIINEARKDRTFNTVRGNSTTAKQLADLDDAGRFGEIGTLATDTAQGNIGRVVTGIGQMMQRMGGLTPEVSENIAKKLTSTDPNTLNNIMQNLQRIESSSASAAQKSNMVQQMATRALVSQTVPEIAAQ